MVPRPPPFAPFRVGTSTTTRTTETTSRTGEPMSDVVERAKAALEGAYEGPWIQVGLGNIHTDPVGQRPPVAKTWTRGNGEFVAQARTLVPELVAEVEELRLVVAADDSTAARIHRQWTQTRRQVRELRAEVERLRPRVIETVDHTDPPD
uniref:Uncharacterized protein n=1 Tax=Mycobacterium phage Farewell TaxID=3158893 RepID=A0AAU8GPU4_9CAUD